MDNFHISHAKEVSRLRADAKQTKDSDMTNQALIIPEVTEIDKQIVGKVLIVLLGQ